MKEVETARIEPNEAGGWTLYLDGDELATYLLTTEAIEELDRGLASFRQWRAERETTLSEYRRHVEAGNCPTWIVAEPYEQSGPCVLAAGHEGEHQTAAGIGPPPEPRLES